MINCFECCENLSLCVIANNGRQLGRVFELWSFSIIRKKSITGLRVGWLRTVNYEHWLEPSIRQLKHGTQKKFWTSGNFDWGMLGSKGWGVLPPNTLWPIYEILCLWSNRSYYKHLVKDHFCKKNQLKKCLVKSTIANK